MLDLSPVSEYEVYVKKFGSDDTRQVATQSGEDCLEADAQTDSIPSSDVWVQWPPEDLRGYGRDEEESEGCVASRDVGVADGLADQSAVRLVTFLKKAGQVRNGEIRPEVVNRQLLFSEDVAGLRFEVLLFSGFAKFLRCPKQPFVPIS